MISVNMKAITQCVLKQTDGILFKCGLVSEVTANYGSLCLTNHVFNVMQSILARKSM